MSTLREEWINNLRPRHLPKNDPNWSPLPGDAVADCMDYDGTYGLVISLFEHDDGWKAIVLWSVELGTKPIDRDAVQHMRKQIADEEDAIILNILRDANGS